MPHKRYKDWNSIILNENDIIINNPSQVAEIFNNFFKTVASDAIRKHREHTSVQKKWQEFDKIDSDFECRPVTVDLVMQRIKNINPKMASGYDNIPSKLIIIAYRELSLPISNLMNTGIRMKTSPTPIKFENFSPIFKSDDNMNKGNFRPVSILPVSSKLHEGILIDEILDHFREIFDVLPSVYRRHYSCQIIILKFVEDVKSVLEGVIWWVTFLLTYPRLSIVSYTVFSLPNCMLIIFQCSPVN